MDVRGPAMAVRARVSAGAGDIPAQARALAQQAHAISVPARLIPITVLQGTAATAVRADVRVAVAAVQQVHSAIRAVVRPRLVRMPAALSSRNTRR